MKQKKHFITTLKFITVFICLTVITNSLNAHDIFKDHDCSKEKFANKIWVTENGNDKTGNGTNYYPYKTISHVSSSKILIT